MILTANLQQKFQLKTYSEFFFYILGKFLFQKKKKNVSTKLDEELGKYDDVDNDDELFFVGTIVGDPHHRKSPVHHEQDLNLDRM